VKLKSGGSWDHAPPLYAKWRLKARRPSRSQRLGVDEEDGLGECALTLYNMRCVGRGKRDI